MIVPINVEESKSGDLAHNFGCSLGSFPFTYLGLPLGLAKPKVVDFLPLVTRCERRLECASTLLSQAGRLQLTNSFCSSLPTPSICVPSPGWAEPHVASRLRPARTCAGRQNGFAPTRWFRRQAMAGLKAGWPRLDQTRARLTVGPAS